MAEEVTLPLPDGMSKEDFEKAIAAMAKEGTKKANNDRPHSEPKTFKVIEKNPTTQIQVYTDIYKDKEINSIREFYLEEDGETYSPTKRGVTYHFEAIDEIIEALQAQKEHLEESGAQGKREEGETDSEV